MRTATRIIGASFGLFAGFGGLEHGYFETLQGNVRPGSILIASIPLVIPIVLLGLLVVSVLAGYGHDIQEHGRAEA